MTKPLNIGVVANTAFNIYNFRLGLIKALQSEGHHVVAIAPADHYVDLLKENDIEFIEVKNLARKGTNPFNDLRLVNEFRNIYKKNKLDIVLQYTIKPNIYGTFAAQLTKTKTICTVTGLGYTFLNNSIGGKVAHHLYRVAFSFADKVLFQNSDDVQTFLENHLVDKNKTHIVPGSGIDTERFSADFCQEIENQRHCERSEAISINNIDGFVPRHDVVRFLMIGRLLKDKGVYEYAEAAMHIKEKYKEVEFHLLGEIDNQNPSAIKKEELESWIKNDILIYHEHTQDTRPYICTADCVVLPSYREGMPRVILEGMAMGKPCITTDAPGCKDAVIDGESGLICKVADVLSLTHKMEQFISMSENHKVLIGKNARIRAQNVYSSGRINDIYLDLVLNLH
jgi:glycosyltransferase involved in cell wall biosynthesis